MAVPATARDYVSAKTLRVIDKSSVESFSSAKVN
jgi:hypothetical protein